MCQLYCLDEVINITRLYILLIVTTQVFLQDINFKNLS